MQRQMATRPPPPSGIKVVCALYPDPVAGYPPPYLRSSIPTIEQYPTGMPTPTPTALDFVPGQLVGCVSGELGLRKFLEERGHEYFVTADKDGEGCLMEKALADAEVVISQPFYPFYLTAERMAKAPKLKLAITAGIGSDHVDLEAAAQHKVDVLEVCQQLAKGLEVPRSSPSRSHPCARAPKHARTHVRTCAESEAKPEAKASGLWAW